VRRYEYAWQPEVSLLQRIAQSMYEFTVFWVLGSGVSGMKETPHNGLYARSSRMSPPEQ